MSDDDGCHHLEASSEMIKVTQLRPKISLWFRHPNSYTSSVSRSTIPMNMRFQLVIRATQLISPSLIVSVNSIDGRARLSFGGRLVCCCRSSLSWCGPIVIMQSSWYHVIILPFSFGFRTASRFVWCLELKYPIANSCDFRFIARCMIV